MNAEGAELLFGVVGFVALTIGVFVVASKKNEKLNDSDDSSVVHLDKLENIANLQIDYEYLLRTKRQSGNLQKDDQIFESPEKAIRAAVTTFKRAKVEYVVVSSNTGTEFCFHRPYHSHRGTNEGKKVGSIEIYRSAVNKTAIVGTLEEAVEQLNKSLRLANTPEYSKNERLNALAETRKLLGELQVTVAKYDFISLPELETFEESIESVQSEIDETSC